MESLSIGMIALILVGIWYLGSTVNNILAASGEVAEKEFKSFKQQQDIRATRVLHI